MTPMTFDERSGGRIRRPMVLTCGLLMLAFTSCGGLGGLLGVQEPEAEYRTFQVASLSLEEIGFDLGFDLANPNAFALPVASLDWSLDLFREPFTFGQVLFEEAGANPSDQTTDGGVLTYLGVQTLPANGELALNTPFNVAIPQTFQGLIRVLAGEDVPFKIAGTLHFQSNFGPIDVPIDIDGVLPNGDVIGFLEMLGSDALGGLLN